ncbi:MAG: AraC family transcriptional regulator [Myxococcales bacterium]|nr:AraC family transcriptional regulator [Myxococcales bacterium]MCB9652426.1 AraC family transcriptional regulator [Deltaproteobacteria bacterium]
MTPTALAELQQIVARHATKEGRTVSVFPDIYFFRATAPSGPKLVETGGVVVAVVTAQAKTIELANHEVLRYEPGSYLFITQQTRYTSTIEAASPEAPYLSVGLALDPVVLSEVLLALDEDGELDADDEEETDGWVASVDDGLADALLRLLRAVEDPVERRHLAPLAMREIIFRLLRSEHAGPLRRAARGDDGRIHSAMRYIQEHFQRRLTVEQLAKTVAMSPSHFAHRFRAVARMSPMRFVKTVRMQQARLLIFGQGLRASEAAEQVGYASASHFTRDFKSHFGASPSAYAREIAV